MPDQPVFGTTLPKISVNAMRSATSTLGGLIFNLLVFHTLHHVAEKRNAALDRAVQVLIDALGIAHLKGSAEEQAETREFVAAIIRQAELLARAEMFPPSDRGKGN